MGISEARKAANARYLAKFERINLTVTAEQKEAIRTAAEQSGQSITQYILHKVFSDTVQDTFNSIVQDTPPRSLSGLPQPPAEIIKQGGNVLIMWLIDNGYTDKEAASFMSGN